jgi:hypothetical protein
MCGCQIAGSEDCPDAIIEQLSAAYFKTISQTCAVTIRDRKFVPYVKFKCAQIETGILKRGLG